MRVTVLLGALALTACTGTPVPQSPPSLELQPPSRSAEAETIQAIQRIEATDSALHAVVAIDPTAIDQARAFDASRRTSGLVAGQPVLLKDNIEATGPLPTTAGSLALAGNVTGRDAPLVARLRAAGAIILGKSNLSEWANMRSSNSISGWSAVGGQTHNPYAAARQRLPLD